MAFSDIETPEELIKYLDSNDRLKERKFVYHYTTVEKLHLMIESKKWYLSSLICMNDQKERSFCSEDVIQRLFFISFMTENEESIGMWSMYSNPLPDGIIIAIPTDKFKNWITDISKIYEVSCNGKCTDNELYKKDFKVFHSSVAYYEDKNKVIHWSNVNNQKIVIGEELFDLSGYVKDFAWDYEKEIRLKIETTDRVEWKKIAVDIPDYIFNSIQITLSPEFDKTNNILNASKIFTDEQIKDSIFKNKLYLNNPCDKCGYNSQKETLK